MNENEIHSFRGGRGGLQKKTLWRPPTFEQMGLMVLLGWWTRARTPPFQVLGLVKREQRGGMKYAENRQRSDRSLGGTFEERGNPEIIFLLVIFKLIASGKVSQMSYWKYINRNCHNIASLFEISNFNCWKHTCTKGFFLMNSSDDFDQVKNEILKY